MAYDVFISYRRRGAGAGVAGELQAKLENRGYKVFLDVDNISSGDFPEQINDAIKGCKDFLLVMSSGVFDRCADEEDWVRREIILAEQYGKNIVGVSLPGFVMPEVDSLPVPLRKIPEKQVFIWSHEYRNASLSKIEENMVSYRRKKNRQRKSATGLVTAVVLAVVALIAWQVFKPVAVEPEVVEEDTSAAIAKEVGSLFVTDVQQGDSLIKVYPDPMTSDQLAVFMKGISSYESALKLARKHPEVALDTTTVGKTLDSLMLVRKERLALEFRAVPVFLDVNDVTTARERYENAKVLAVTEGEKNEVATLGQRFKE